MHLLSDQMSAQDLRASVKQTPVQCGVSNKGRSMPLRMTTRKSGGAGRLLASVRKLKTLSKLVVSQQRRIEAGVGNGTNATYLRQLSYLS